MKKAVRAISWMGSSRKDLIAMPDGIRKDFGGALHAAQEGAVADGAKSFKGKLSGAVQLSEDFDNETYRAVYTAEMDGYIYVLHCFQKKSKSGIKTPQADLDLIESRLKDARAYHKHRILSVKTLDRKQ